MLPCNGLIVIAETLFPSVLSLIRGSFSSSLLISRDFPFSIAQVSGRVPERAELETASRTVPASANCGALIFRTDMALWDRTEWEDPTELHRSGCQKGQNSKRHLEPCQHLRGSVVEDVLDTMHLTIAPCIDPVCFRPPMASS
jgi:hypothetical protein